MKAKERNKRYYNKKIISNSTVNSDEIHLKKEQNEILKNILEILNGNDTKRNKSYNWTNIISLILSIISIGASIFTTYSIFKMEGFNKCLLLSDIELKIDDSNEDSYLIEFDIKQGGIKKAFIATISDEGTIKYDNISEKAGKKTISFTRNAEVNQFNLSDCEIVIQNRGGVQNGSLNGIIEKKYISDFAFVILDTTDQWWVYYIIVSPEYVPNNSVYCLYVYGEDAELIAKHEKQLETQEITYTVIDGSLTNIVTIRDKIESELKKDYNLYNSDECFSGINGEVFRCNPKIINLYKPPDAEDVYNNILNIHEDIDKLSF